MPYNFVDRRTAHQTFPTMTLPPPPPSSAGLKDSSTARLKIACSARYARTKQQ